MRVTLLGCLSPAGVQGVMEDMHGEEAVREIVESVGAKLESLMFTRGEYDSVVLVDVPDEDTILELKLAIISSGEFSKYVVLEEVNMKRIREIAQKAQKPIGHYATTNGHYC